MIRVRQSSLLCLFIDDVCLFLSASVCQSYLSFSSPTNGEALRVILSYAEALSFGKGPRLNERNSLPSCHGFPFPRVARYNLAS
jgi:hypothetical protein